MIFLKGLMTTIRRKFLKNKVISYNFFEFYDFYKKKESEE
jgi:hypothetical protein